MTYDKVLRFVIIGGIIIGLAAFFYFISGSQARLNGSEDLLEVAEEIIIPEFRKELIEIETGDTYGVVMGRANLVSGLVSKIYAASQPIYDLAKIKAGHKIELIYGYQDNEFKELVYKIDTEKELVVKLDEAGELTAQIRDIPYETKIVLKEGEISSSLYEAAMSQGIDERAVIALANTFQWTIDFAMDPRVGDTFKFIYEEKFLEGEYTRPGRVLAGKYVNDGKPFYLFYFNDGAKQVGYYDENGNSVQKMFLKAPVEFKYISSGFTTGLRYVEAFNVSTGHRAIDYAAPTGTPIRSVGDGTITFAGWNGSYGYMVSVRHNGTYSTNYAHMSRMAIKKGDKVKQGQIIGYVGSTGFSTGPHLHYEMVKNGVKINPLTEVLPPGEPLSSDVKDKFLTEIISWQEQLD